MRVVRAVAAAILALGATVAPAAWGAPNYPGDLEPTFVGWFDPAGRAVDAVAPGEQIVAHYTITNSLDYPIRVNAVDSQLTYGACVRDFARASHSTDVDGEFPLYLAPGETSRELVDVGFTQAPASHCSGGLPRWYGNVIGEQGTSPTPTPAGSATVQVTTTQTVTETRRADPSGFLVPAGIGAVVVVGGIVALSVARRRTRGRS